MSVRKNDIGSTGAWYSLKGADDDVVLSTHIRLARNLANFPFPENFTGDNGDRVQVLVFDSFSHIQNPENYQTVAVKDIDEIGYSILREREVLDDPSCTGIAMRRDGRVACSINGQDHVHISSFVSGLDAEGAFSICHELDEQMQRSVQFAASYDFGFLTSSIYDTGSGMKVSVCVHIPSLDFSGKTAEYAKTLSGKNIGISPRFGFCDNSCNALGSYYYISSLSSFAGSEVDQIASVVASIRHTAEFERRTRQELIKESPTKIHDVVNRAYAMTKYSRLVTTDEAVKIISSIKWGHDMGFLSGIEDSDLHALLYRIQRGHLGFLLSNGSFAFEKDIEDNHVLHADRLRSLILQEALENTSFTF